jgi:hypothetical protein
MATALIITRAATKRIVWRAIFFSFDFMVFLRVVIRAARQFPQPTTRDSQRQLPLPGHAKRLMHPPGIEGFSFARHTSAGLFA